MVSGIRGNRPQNPSEYKDTPTPQEAYDSFKEEYPKLDMTAHTLPSMFGA
jgi:hypothetical protein